MSEPKSDEEIVEEFSKKFTLPDELGRPQLAHFVLIEPGETVNYTESEDTRIARLMLDWLRTTLPAVRKEERDRIVEEMHVHFPVPNMAHAEMWPHDEQIRWSGIGEVMIKLKELAINK